MVFKAKDGLKAWDLFNMENIDVVLTDILRPDSNVKELCRRIRNHSPLVKIALMAYGGAVDVELFFLRRQKSNWRERIRQSALFYPLRK